MRNPRYDIYKSFGAALQGITLGGNAIPVYSISPQKAPEGIYIVLGSITTNQEGCKQNFGHECTMDIQVIDNTRKNYITPKNIEEVTTNVMANIFPKTTSVLALDNFDMTWLTITNSFNDSGMFEDGRGSRNVVQFSFEVFEKTVFDVWILETNFWNDMGRWDDFSSWND